MQIAALSSEAQHRSPRLAELTAAIEKRQEKMTGMEEQINAVKDSVYASFSKQVGSNFVQMTFPRVYDTSWQLRLVVGIAECPSTVALATSC